MSQEVKINNKKLTHRKTKHNWWKYLLTFIGGFIFAFVAVGITLGVIAFATPTKDVVNMFGINASEVLGADYLNGSLFDTIMALSKSKYETLGDINKVTPVVQKTVEQLNNDVLMPNLKMTLDWEQLKTKPFVLDPNSTRPEEEYDHTTSIGDYIPKAIKDGVTLVNFIEGDIDNMLKVFLYNTSIDEQGNLVFGDPYTLTDIIEGDVFTTKIETLRVGDILDLDGNPFMGQMGNWLLTDFTNNPDELIKDLQIGLLFSDEEAEDNPLIATLKGTYSGTDGLEHPWTIGALTDFNNINNLKISNLVNITETSGLLYSIKDNTIADLQNSGFVNRLVLKDVFPSSGGILGTLTNFDIYSYEHEAYYTVGTGYLDAGRATYYHGEGAPTINSGYVARDYSTDPMTPGDIYMDINESTPNNMYIFESTGWRKVSGFTIGDLNDSDKVLSLKLSDVLTDLPDDPLINTIKNKELKELSNLNTSEFKISEIFTAEDIAANQLLKELTSAEMTEELGHEITVADLSNFDTFKKIDLGALFDVTDTSSILYKIFNRTDSLGQRIKPTIDNLEDLVNTLTLKEVTGVNVGYIADGKSNEYKGEGVPTDGDYVVRDLTHGIPGDIYVDTSTDPNDLYIYMSTGWSKVSSGNYDSEKLAYYGEEGFFANIMRSIGGTGINEISTAFETLTIDDLFNVSNNPDAPQMLKSLKNFKLNELDTALDTLKVKDVMDIYPGDIYVDTSSSPNNLYIYFSEGWELVPTNLYNDEYNAYFGEDGFIANHEAKAFYGEGEPTVTGAKARDTLYSARETLISDSGDLINQLKNNLKLRDVMDIDDDSPLLLRNLKNYKINEIVDIVPTLKLSDVIEVTDTSPQILKTLANVAIFGTNEFGVSDLEAAISGLKFCDYFSYDDCKDNNILLGLWNSTIVNVGDQGGNFAINQIGTQINNLRIADFMGNQIYKDGVKANGYDPIWWFLLSDELYNSAEGGFNKDPNLLGTTVSNFNDIMGNIKFHILNEPLIVLDEAGIVTLTDAQKANPFVANTTIQQIINNL